MGYHAVHAAMLSYIEARDAEREQKRLDQAADLREALDGDPTAAERFASRLLELERRFDAWRFESWARKQKRIAWKAAVKIQPATPTRQPTSPEK